MTIITIVTIMHNIEITKLNIPKAVEKGGNMKLKFMKKVKVTNCPMKNVKVNPQTNIFFKNVRIFFTF